MAGGEGEQLLSCPRWSLPSPLELRAWMGVCARSVIRGAAGPWLYSSTGQCVCGLVRHRLGGGRGDRGPKCGLPALPSGLTGPCWVCPGHGGQGTSGRAFGERGLMCLSVLWGGAWGQAWRFSVKNRAASLPSSPSASTRSAARLTGHGQGVAPERCCAPENGVSDKNNPS